MRKQTRLDETWITHKENIEGQNAYPEMYYPGLDEP